MFARKKLILSSILIFIWGSLLYSWVNFATDRSVLHQLNKFPQNAFFYLNQRNSVTIESSKQAFLTKNFTTHYFSPWNQVASPEKISEIKNDQLIEIKKFDQKPGIGANTHLYSKSWIKNLENNVDLSHFPNFNQNAITLRETNIRILPTSDPSFTDFKSVSKGYPFDNLQQTFIPAGTPIHIVHVSKDKAWDLVFASSYSGWILDKDIAVTSPEFEKTWQTGQYAVSKQDDIPLFDDKKRLTTKTRIGVLYPITQITENNFQILTPSETASGDATTKLVLVNKQFLNHFPVLLTSQNIAKVANNLIGKPYGWGGIYGYRDCSATTRDLFATFGIWLPRNSSNQADTGQSISLKGLNDSEKEKLILEKGIPFLTLIHIPGHIVLYIGEKNHHPMVFQNLWGVHVYKLFSDNDRIVIGKTVITPLKFGKRFINVSLNHLAASDRMTFLVPPSLLHSGK